MKIPNIFSLIKQRFFNNEKGLMRLETKRAYEANLIGR